MGEGINRRVFLQGSAMSAGALALPGDDEPSAAGPVGTRVGRTTVEYADTLLGTDVANPPAVLGPRIGRAGCRPNGVPGAGAWRLGLGEGLLGQVGLRAVRRATAAAEDQI